MCKNVNPLLNLAIDHTRSNTVHSLPQEHDLLGIFYCTTLEALRRLQHPDVLWSDGRSLTQSLFSFCFRGEGAASPLNSRRSRLGDRPTQTAK